MLFKGIKVGGGAIKPVMLIMQSDTETFEARKKRGRAARCRYKWVEMTCKYLSTCYDSAGQSRDSSASPPVVAASPPDLPPLALSPTPGSAEGTTSMRKKKKEKRFA